MCKDTLCVGAGGGGGEINIDISPLKAWVEDPVYLLRKILDSGTAQWMLERKGSHLLSNMSLKCKKCGRNHAFNNNAKMGALSLAEGVGQASQRRLHWRCALRQAEDTSQWRGEDLIREEKVHTVKVLVKCPVSCSLGNEHGLRHTACAISTSHLDNSH